MNLSVEHVLLFLVIVFFLYHLIGKCGCRNGFSVGGKSTLTVDIRNLNLDPKNNNRVEYEAKPPRSNTYTWTGEKDNGNTTTTITINDSMITTLNQLRDIFGISKIQVIQVGGLPRWLRPYDYVIQITTISTFMEDYWFNDMTGDKYDIGLDEGGIHEISYNSKNPTLKYINT